MVRAHIDEPTTDTYSGKCQFRQGTGDFSKST